MANETEDQKLEQENTEVTKSIITGMEKKYPKAAMVKKGLVMLVVLVGLIVGGVIVTNIYRSSHPNIEKKPTETSQVTNIRGGDRPTWDNGFQVRKAESSSVIQANATKQGQTNPANVQAKPLNGKTNAASPAPVSANKTNDDEMKKILSAPISSNQINFEISPNTNSGSQATSSSSLPTTRNDDDQSSKSDQNLQSEKKAFVKLNTYASDDYLHEGLKNPVSPYEIKAGTIIPAILITGINSDLPGQIIAQVRSNVYDTIAGKHLLVPQGAKLTGLYDSQIAYGQERVLIVWKRIILPNGQSVNLEGMPGVDMSGYAGFNDQVNNHYGKIFGSVILMSVISAGAQLSQPQNNNNNVNSNPTVNQALAASLGTNIMNTANSLLQKNLNIQPTLVIRPGYLMSISVTKDIVFPKEYEEGTAYDN
jgi:type IV secretory pathway VirB10-like protein